LNYHVIVDPGAKQDLSKIKRYLSKFYPGTPKRFQAALNHELKLLTFCPGGVRYEQKPHYRKCVFYNNYVMFYTVNERAKTICIQRIFHGSQDITNII